MTQDNSKTHANRTETAPESIWMFDTMQQASSFTGTPISLLKASKKAGCRAFKLGNRVSFLEFVRWYFNKDAVETGIPEGFASWREVLEAEKARRETIKRQIDEKNVMLTADAQRQAAEACAFVDSELQRGESELPPVLAGLPAVECGKILHAFTEKLRINFKSKFKQVGE